MYETVKALSYAYEKIGCFPKEIKTDNGIEFSDGIRLDQKETKLLKEIF